MKFPPFPFSHRESAAVQPVRDQTVFLPKAKAGQVKLEGHLHRKSSKTLETEFKIGIGRMYVLKSISKMVAAVQNMETVSYGAQLSFLHCMDAFQEESRPMVSFLTSYAEETNACFQMASGLYGSYLDDRYLTLTVQNLDEFFLALGEQVLPAAHNRIHLHPHFQTVCFSQ